MTLIEFTVCSSQHTFRDGLFVDNNQDPSDMNNDIQVECDDCGMVKLFSRNQIRKGKAPKWLQNRYCKVANQELVNKD